MKERIGLRSFAAADEELWESAKGDAESTQVANSLGLVDRFAQ